MKNTRRFRQELRQLYPQLLELTEQSALTSSHAHIQQTITSLNELHTITQAMPPCDKTERLYRYLHYAIAHLLMSYEHALSNNWAECDYQHSIALMNLETLTVLMQQTVKH